MEKSKLKIKLEDLPENVSELPEDAEIIVDEHDFLQILFGKL